MTEAERGHIYISEDMSSCHTCEKMDRLVVLSDHELNDTDEINIGICIKCAREAVSKLEMKHG